jgi:membrane fusion protein, heavy metal efflux system
VVHIYPPVTGHLVKIWVQLGDTVKEGEFKTDPTQPLMIVADLSHVWLSANVQEKDLHFLSIGQDIGATLIAYPGLQLSGKVLYIGDMLDPDTRTTKVRLLLDNPDGRLKPGMFATVEIKDVPKEEITVPMNAVVQVGSSALMNFWPELQRATSISLLRDTTSRSPRLKSSRPRCRLAQL